MRLFLTILRFTLEEIDTELEFEESDEDLVFLAS
jgi:hypothetical protein